MPSATFSPGSDPVFMKAALAKLLPTRGGDGRWTLSDDGQAIERSFKFKNFTKTWDFMTAVSLQCKIKNHHPEWSNVYNTTFIRWTTHSPRGLSSKDLDLAAICDALARDFGEVIGDSSEQQHQKNQQKKPVVASEEQQQQQQQQQQQSPLSTLANEAVTSAGGDCGCGPK